MTTTWNYSDTAVSSDVGPIQPASINFAADWAKKTSDESELILINTTSPLDRVETLRFGRSRIGNIYTGAGIEAAYASSVRSGVSALVQDRTVLTAVDDAGNRTDYPISAHLIIKVPTSDLITEQLLVTILSRLLGACYEQSGTTAGPRLNRLIRGALIPSSML